MIIAANFYGYMLHTLIDGIHRYFYRYFLRVLWNQNINSHRISKMRKNIACATSNYLSKIPSTKCMKFIYVIKIPCNKINRSELQCFSDSKSLFKDVEKETQKKKSRAIKSRKNAFENSFFFLMLINQYFGGKYNF